MDFRRESPKFWFEFCCGFWGGFFLSVFRKEDGPKKSTKKSPTKFTQSFVRKNSPRILSGPVLRDTARLSQRYPPIARYGVFGCLNMANRVRYPLPLFWAFSPWGACEVEVRYHPLKRGISAILARYPMKTRQMGAIPPSAILSRKGIARYGGVSRTGPLSSDFCRSLFLIVCGLRTHRPSKTGKEGFGVEKPPFPTTRKRSNWVRKSPFLDRAPQAKGGFSDSNCPFSVLVGMGVFRPRRGEFNTKFLAARQFISPTQAPRLSAASEGLQNRKKYNTSNIYTVN